MSSISTQETSKTGSDSGERTTDDSADDTSQPEAVPGTAAELSKDRIFELLSVQRRRDVLKYLDEVESETTLSSLAEHIAAKENEIDVRDISATQRKRVYVGLYQSHLPKMDDANILDYDQARGTIEIRAEAAQLFPYLRIDPANALKTDQESRCGDSTPG